MRWWAWLLLLLVPVLGIVGFIVWRKHRDAAALAAEQQPTPPAPAAPPPPPVNFTVSAGGVGAVADVAGTQTAISGRSLIGIGQSAETQGVAQQQSTVGASLVAEGASAGGRVGAAFANLGAALAKKAAQTQSIANDEAAASTAPAGSPAQAKAVGQLGSDLFNSLWPP